MQAIAVAKWHTFCYLCHDKYLKQSYEPPVLLQILPHPINAK